MNIQKIHRPINYEPLVSVIIPLYNAENYVGKALQSIVGQSYRNLEIIVVIDGSTDNSPKIVKSFKENDSRIIIIEQENKGQCAASNVGFRNSTGTFIKFFDADDILSVNAIEIQVKSLISKTDTDASYLDYIRFYDDVICTTDRYVLPTLITYDCSPEDYITYHGSPQMYQCAIWLFHRNIFNLSGLWDERLSLINDTEFFPRILKYVTKLYYAADCKLYYRTNYKSGSLSQVVTTKSIKSAVLSIDLMAQHTRSFIHSELMEKIIAQSYIEILEMSYPSQPKWTKIIARRLRMFRKDQYEFLLSGPVYNFFFKNFGWKTAKQLQSIYYKLKYKTKKSSNPK